MSNSARDLTEFFTIPSAADNKNPGNYVYALPSSVTSILKSEYALSTTIAAIDGSWLAASNTVAAPIDLPQSAT